MALIQLQQPFLTFRGRNDISGGQVVYPTGGRNFARTFVQPTNPSTPAQDAIRTFLTLASQAYGQVTDAEFDVWSARAATLLRSDPNGSLYDTTAKGLYVGVNVNRQIDGQAITDAAPPAVVQAAVTGLTSVTVNPDGIIVFTHSNADGFFLFQVTQPLPALRRQPREGDFFMPSTVLAENIVARAASPQTVTIPSANLRAQWVEDSRVAIKITSLSPGYVKGQSRTFQTLVLV